MSERILSAAAGIAACLTIALTAYLIGIWERAILRWITPTLLRDEEDNNAEN